MIVVAGYLNTISTLSDNSVKLVISTQEVSPQMAGDLFGVRGKFLKVILSEENVSEEIKEVIKDTRLEAPKKEGKSHSQRLRAVLYRVWEQNGEQGDFEAFYQAKMEVIIDHYKGQLE